MIYQVAAVVVEVPMNNNKNRYKSQYKIKSLKFHKMP
jgi:hypothetical protein